MSISIASAAAALTVSSDGKVIEEIRVAMGSLAPTVVRARKFEAALRGSAAGRIFKEIFKGKKDFCAGRRIINIG